MVVMDVMPTRVLVAKPDDGGGTFVLFAFDATVIELVGLAIEANPAVLGFGGGEGGVLGESAIGDAAVGGAAFGVDAELEPVGFGAGEVVQVQTADDEMAAAEAKAGGAGKDGFSGGLGADGDGCCGGAFTVEAEIGVFPIAYGEDNRVTRFSSEHGFAGGLGIGDGNSGSGQRGGGEEESEEWDEAHGWNNGGQAPEIAMQTLTKKGGDRLAPSPLTSDADSAGACHVNITT